MTRLRWILAIGSFGAAVGVAVWVIVASWPAHGAPLGLPWWAHLLALSVVGAELVLRTAKIALSARACGIALPFGTAARATLGGDFATALTPARTGAEPARFMVLIEAGVSPPNALLVLFLEVVVEMISLVIVAIALVVVLPHTAGLRALLGTVGGYGAVVLAIGAAGYLLSTRRSRGPSPAWARTLGVNAALWRRVQRAVRHLRESVRALRYARPRVMAVAMVASIVHVAARLSILPIIVLGSGVPLDLPQLIIRPLMLLYGGAMIPAPAGGGVMELGFKVLMQDVLPASHLGTALVWWRIYSYYVYVVLGAVAAGRTVMRALRRPSAADLTRAGDPLGVDHPPAR